MNKVPTENKFIIEDTLKKQIDHWVSKYPPDRKRSAVVPALLLVQEQNEGWLSEAAMNAVAEYLQLAPIEVYEVASFYDMYELKPIGKHKISICTNLSCTLMNVKEIADYAKNRLGINFGETTADGKFTLRETECLAACGGAPVCQINNKEYVENLTVEKIAKIIDEMEATATT